MPLIAANLKTEMLNATEGGTDKGAVLDKLAKAIQDYVKDNCLFAFSWAASDPSSGTPDPALVATGEFTSLTVQFITLKVQQPDSAEAALGLMAADLITSFSTAQYNIGIEGFATSPGVFSSSPTIGTLVLAPSQKDKREDAFDVLANSIVTWVTSQVPVAPCAGTHSNFVGAGMVTKVS